MKKKKGRIIHKELKESFSASHRQIQQQGKYYSNRAKNFKREWMSPKTEEMLDSDNYKVQNYGLYRLEGELKKHIPRVGYRTMSDFLRKFKSNFPTLSHEALRRRMRTKETMFYRAIEEAMKEVEEEVEENPYLTDYERGEIVKRAVEKAIKRLTKEKIRASKLKYPLGTR